MTLRELIAAALMGTALTGCAAGPAPRVPTPPASAQAPFIGAPAGTLPGGEPAAAWWRLYEDPVLDDLVVRALAANTDLRIAVANLKAAEAVLSESRNARLPQTTLSANAGYGRDQAPAPSNDERTVYGGGLDVAYEADLFGRVSRSIEAARADAEAESFARAAVQVRVAAAVTQAYLSACTAAETIASIRTSVALTGESARLVGLQERSGAAAVLDVARAEAQLAETRASLAPAEAARASALYELAALLGLSPREVPEAASRCAAAPEPRGPIAIGDGAGLLRRRPDVAQAERRLAAATARVGVATADLYPRITIGASVSQVGGDGIEGDQGFSFGVGPLLSVAFPNMGAGRARVRQADARAEAALASFDGVVLTALKEVEQALSAYDGALRRRSDLRTAEARADQVFRLADQRYRVGAIANLDLIVAQNELVRLRLARTQADQEAALQRVDLFRALGGGWQT
jgi:NodT family efflux transporter outer membrane factor (OMF) lipoprotein